jgi:hypothetical protein
MHFLLDDKFADPPRKSLSACFPQVGARKLQGSTTNTDHKPALVLLPPAVDAAAAWITANSTKNNGLIIAGLPMYFL